jgi:hypothetical protein
MTPGWLCPSYKLPTAVCYIEIMNAEHIFEISEKKMRENITHHFFLHLFPFLSSQWLQPEQ